MGLSDRPAQLPTIEARVDDLRCVLDELGVGRAVLVGVGAACAVLTVFAASEPDRVKAVVLFHPPDPRGVDSGPPDPLQPSERNRAATAG